MEMDDVNDKRLRNEIAHGSKIAACSGDVWNWETAAGRKRWARRVSMLTDGIVADMAVLEVGCGTGYYTRELAKTGARIKAIDISPDLLDVARREVSSERVEFCIENAYALSFPDDAFDVVVGSSVLHHLEISEAVREIYRVLKPGGMFRFTEPNMLNPQIALQKNIHWLKERLGDSPDETAFFSWQMVRLLREAGFVEVVVEPFDFLHPAVPASLVTMIERAGLFMERIPLIRELAGSLYIRAYKP